MAEVPGTAFSSFQELHVGAAVPENIIIGASLSEPHIDHDNVPRHGECLYLSMYLSGCV